MKILFVVAEVAPYVKTGGLGEVANALPKELHRLGHEVALYVPLHGLIDRKYFSLIPICKDKVLKFGQRNIHHRFMVGVLSQTVPVYFFDYKLFSGGDCVYGGRDGNWRYLLFNEAVFSLIETLGWVPDIIHCNDWPAGLIPNKIAQLHPRSRYKKIKTVFTVHNAAFAGTINPWELPIERQDSETSPIPIRSREIESLNFLRRGIRFADVITTVSEIHAKELKANATGHGLADLLKDKGKNFVGIRNGVDYNIFNPRTDYHLPVNYDSGLLHRKYDNKRALQHRLGLTIDDQIPMLGMNTRISEQKGFDLIFEILPQILKLGVQFVVVGTGQGRYIEILNDYSKSHPKQFAYRPYSEELGSWVYSGADLFLMPSLYEPSGLGQIISLRYGTIPLVRRTGGLAGTITDYHISPESGNGFVFETYDSRELLKTIRRSLGVFRNKKHWWRLMRRAMELSYSWEIPAAKYIKLYRRALKKF